ncbi:MAG: TolC family outer membrane protein [Rhodobacter sp.]|nr:TolC family outer membrane protein [Rhodobacter sp.]
MLRTARNLVMTVSLIVGAALPVSAETLADALIAAYRNSNLLAQNQAVLRAADEDVAQAVATLRPVVAFVADGQYGYSEQLLGTGLTVVNEGLFSNLALSAQMMVFDFGRTQLAIEAAKETVLATREALISVEQQVLLAAVSAFVSVRLQQEIVSLRENNVRVIGEQLRAAQDRFEVGEVTRTDVAQAEARLAQARANLVVAQGDLAIARENYRAATGNYPGALSAPPAPPRIADTLDAARSVALRTHPAIRQAQREVKAAELTVARARANLKPTLSATASLSVDQDGLQENGFGLSLRQTIYSGGALSSALRQSIANREARFAGLQQRGVEVAENVGTVWSNLDVADASITATEQQIAAAQIAFDGVREEASLGARTTLDVLDAEQDLLDARASRLTAEAQRYVGIYQLLSSMGLLTVDHLELGIPTYDPAAYYNAVRRAPTSIQGQKLDRIMKSAGND